VAAVQLLRDVHARHHVLVPPVSERGQRLAEVLQPEVEKRASQVARNVAVLTAHRVVDHHASLAGVRGHQDPAGHESV
jgi:hypothetical protein